MYFIENIQIPAPKKYLNFSASCFVYNLGNLVKYLLSQCIDEHFTYEVVTTQPEKHLYIS